MGPWVHGPIQARWAYGPMGPCAAAPSAPLQRTPPHRSLCGGSVGPSAAATPPIGPSAAAPPCLLVYIIYIYNIYDIYICIYNVTKIHTNLHQTHIFTKNVCLLPDFCESWGSGVGESEAYAHESTIRLTQNSQQNCNKHTCFVK